MRNIFLALAGLLLITSVSAQTKTNTAPKATTTTKSTTASKPQAAKPAVAHSTDIKNVADSFSYAVGVSSAQYVSQMLTQQDVAGLINVDLFLSAFEDMYKKGTVRMPQERIGVIINNTMQQVHAVKLESNRKAGDAFLAANAKKDSVVTLPSGLQYKILTAGTGVKPAATDNVKVHYHGTLIDGTVFDSSVDRGEPITLNVSQVIPGWTEALQLMSVGSKWRLFIPASLAYGDRDAGQQIKAGSTLVFDVTLMDIVKGEAAPAAPAAPAK